MERAEYLDLFERLDNPPCGETTGRLERIHFPAVHRFLALARDVEHEPGEKCSIEYGSQIQDASFYALLSVPKNCKLQEDYVVSLRVSNFGSLATLYDANDVVKPGCLDKFKDTLKRHDYIYIPSWILREPYPSHANTAGDVVNWGERYFDWL